MVCNPGQTGVVAPSENGRLPPVLAHQLASAKGGHIDSSIMPDQGASVRPRRASRSGAGTTAAESISTLRDPNRKNDYSKNNYKKMRQMSEQARDKNA